ncbi:abortive infection family protein [Terribacillus aidingensis]|uniref:abortive infection family protein n=1 Tax=Terribacillus aidingensis TaxID=586416 RepID=UPI00344B2D65
MNNQTIEILSAVKTGLMDAYIRFIDEAVYWDIVSDEDYRTARRIIRTLCEKVGMEVPNFVEESLTVEEFCRYLSQESYGGYGDNALEITALFNKLISYLDDNMYEVQIIKVESDIPKELKFDSIIDDLMNCETRIDVGDYSGAITSARSMVEGVCKEILIKCGVKEISYNSVPSLFDKVRKVLNLDPSDESLDKPLKQIISGLNKTVGGLNEIRNKVGDGHAGRRRPTLHHAVLAVNAAKTITNFLFHTLEYQKEKGTIAIVSEER